LGFCDREIKCINFNPNKPDEKRAKLSLFFKGYDRIEKRNVGLKFFDHSVLNPYRLRAFQR